MNTTPYKDDIRHKSYWAKQLLDYNFTDFFNSFQPKQPLHIRQGRDSCTLVADNELNQKFLAVSESLKGRQIFLATNLLVMAQKCSGANDVLFFTPDFLDSDASNQEGTVLPIRIENFQNQSFKEVLNTTKNKIIKGNTQTNCSIFSLLKDRVVNANEISSIGCWSKGVQEDSSINKLELDLLFIFDIHQNLELTIDYNSQKYDAKTIEKLAQLFFDLLKNLLLQSTVSISEIELTSEENRKLLLQELDFTNVKYPEDETLCSLFKKQVEIYGDKIAIEFKGAQLTYKDLDERSNQVANLLLNNNVKPGDVIGFLTDRSEDTVVGILGILKVGAAYVPIDIDYPEKRKEYIITNSKTELVLTVTQDDEISSVKVLSIQAAASFSINPVSVTISPEDLSYIIYTSGTTGNPKGVMISHKNVVRLLFNDNFNFSFVPDDVWLMFHSPCFDISVWEIFGALLYGSSLIIIPKESAVDTATFIEILREKKVTVLTQTPSAFYNFVYHDLQHIKADLNLRYIALGGEAFSPAKIKVWFKKRSHIKVINMYGITETTVHNTFHEITQHDIDYNVSNIGKPLPTLSAYVMDYQRNLVPKGMIGELYVGGLGVAKGYLGMEALTKERFITNPYKQEETIYKSGDLVRILDNGDLEYHGRIDHQIQLRGYRIELGEIENQLINFSEISDTVVLLREKEESSYLIAFYVSKKEIDKDILKMYLEEHLLEYMIPTRFVFVDKIPITSNGKVDRVELFKLAETKTKEKIQPTGEFEIALTEIWSTLLRINKDVIGRDDNFFELGGNSLAAVLLKHKIASSFQLSINITQIFENGELSDMANLIANSEKFITTPIPVADIKDFYPLSPAQKRLYFIYQFDKQSTTYNMPFANELKGELDKTKLEKAVSNLIARHEILRTVFEVIEGKPVQVVKASGIFEIEYYPEGTNTANVVKEFRKPFSLESLPLFRIGVLPTSDNASLLLFDIHHIISDGISQTLLLDELISFYNGVELPAPKLQYKDYVAWFNSNEQRTILERQKQYWLSKFTEVPVSLNLPSDHKRPIQKSYKGDTLSFQFDSVTTQEIKRTAQECGVSVYMLLLALYTLFISKVSQEEDIVIGTITSGRVHPDMEKLLGVFVGTLPIRIAIDSTKSFEQLLAVVKKDVVQALEHQSYPYEDLIDNLKLDRNTSRNPLFDICMVFQNFEKASEEIKNISIENHETNYKLSKFDLSFIVHEFSDSLYFGFEYSTEIFNQATIERFISIFQTISSQALASRDEKIATIKIIDVKDQNKLKRSLSSFSNEPKLTSTVIEVIGKRVKETPNAVAVSFGKEQLTYHQLEEKANRVASFLQSKGVKRGSIIAVLLDRSPTMITTLIGIMKTGAAYLPIDLDSPAKRTQQLLDDSNARALLTTSDLKSNFALTHEVFLVDELDSFSFNPCTVTEKLSPNDSAYILYTSGTSGNPKGVVVTHKNLMNMFFHPKFLFDFSSKDVWTMFHRYCFDFSVWEMFGALVFGGKLVLISKEDSLDPLQFMYILKKEKVTVLNQTPTAFKSLMQEDLKQHDTPLENLRYVIFGGEKLNPKNLLEWHVKYPSTRLVNMYGITETTIHVTYKELSNQEIKNNTASVGKPLPGYYTYILDKDMQFLPKGYPGELYVGGNGVAQGYLNNAELTKNKFIKDPYRKDGTLYKTGDLVKINHENELEYLGRIDHQIQLKGFRIELGEIEIALSNYRFIHDAKVVIKERDDEVFLVAYYTADKELETVQLRRLLTRSIPLYMIPSYFVHVEHLSLTANGKLNVGALPNPVFVSSKGYVAPNTPVEKQIAHIWSTTLGVETIGVNDNYFAIGGDSITAIRVISMLNNLLITHIKIVDLYNHQTIKELASYVTNEDAEESDHFYSETEVELEQFNTSYLSKKPDETIEVVYPMSNIEKAMCFIQLKNTDDTLYYEQLLWDVAYENFSIEALTKALFLISKKQNALRTAFDLSENAHVIYKELSIDVPFRDISDETKTNQLEIIKKDMEHSRKNCFMLDEPPLWKMSVYKINKNHHTLLFEIHHAISDGWSIATFTNELNNTYKTLLLDADYTPTPLKSGYREFIIEEIVHDKKQEGIAYWKKELKDFKKFTFGHTASESSFKSLRVPLENDLFNKLDELASKRNTTVKNIFFAAYLQTLNLLSYENDIVAGLVTFNRLIGEDGIDVFGNFLNTIPVRFQFKDAFTSKKLLDALDEKLKEIKTHDRTSLFKIGRAIGLKDFTQNPITDLLFNFTSFHVTYELSLEKINHSEKIEKVEIKDFIRGHGLFEVSVNGVKDNCFIQYDYVTSFLSDEKFRQFQSIFTRLLSFFTTDYNTEIRLEHLMPKQHKLLTKTFNDEKVTYPKEKTFLDYFNEQVKKASVNVALHFEGKTLTYKEVDDKSNKLAKYLLSSGLQAEELVPISLERSFEMVIAIVGILKAGGAYVPIDPLYPIARKSYIINDTVARFIITNSKEKEVLKTVHETLEFICLETTTLENSNYFEGNLPDVCSSHLAYVIYTSGTTGKPKGVLNTHAGIFNRLLWMQSYLEIDNRDIFLQKTTYCFDVSVWEFLLPLMFGARLVIAKPEGQRDSQYIANLIRERGVTHVHFVPSMLSVFLQLNTTIENLTYLKSIICSGEALNVPLAKRFMDKLPNITLHNFYGPTEAAIDVTAIEIKPKHIKSGIVPIGYPVANTQLYIVNDTMQLQPVGVPGEIIIGGVQVAKGYLNKKALSDEKFIKNPFVNDAYSLYRTGDLGQWLEDGSIQYLGRIDDQIKLRGYRIELGEIETQLLSFDKIVDAVAIVKSNKAEDSFIVGYYVASEDFEHQELTSFLLEKLPSYMIPSFYSRLEKMPLTVNGKLDRKKLPEVTLDTTEIFEAPTTDLEKKIVTIWAEILDIDSHTISINKSFFEIGGHSLNATVLINKLSKEFEKEFPLQEIFTKNTVKDMAEYIGLRLWLSQKGAKEINKIEL